MKVLVIGSGGREHTLIWKIAQSPKVDKVYAAPGNAGMAQIAELVSIQEPQDLVNFAKKENIDFTVVGPEQPLVEGIVDLFKQNGLSVFGPSKKGAQLEGSKVFAKEFMKRNGIPTSSYQLFQDLDLALKHLEKIQMPTVIKADGLAAGKGVTVAQTKEEAESAIRSILQDKIFGEAGNQVVIEDCLQGEEISILALVDGKTILSLETSQDHKRIFENDEGPNTGGMGAISPSPLYDETLKEKIEKQVLQPALKGIQKENLDFHGILYAGLMIDSAGNPFVLEFNVRFGDPETQAVLVRLDSDLFEVMRSTAEEKLSEVKLSWKRDFAMCVVLASGGYPGKYEKGKEISGLDEANASSDTVVFHAGTSIKEGKIATSGGRVLGVTSWGENLQDAKEKVYAAIEKIHFESAYYRRDIGKKALEKEQSWANH